VVIALGAGPPIYARLSGGGHYSMPSGSMKPTFFAGDRFLGKKLDRDLRHGDVIVFDHPKKPGIDYIKRVIALPGDTFAMVDGTVQLNGEMLDVERTDNFEEPVRQGPGHQACLNAPVPDAELCQIERWVETLPNGASHEILNLGSTRMDNTAPMSIPEGSLLVLGDNRDNSVDSRFPSVGLVPFENVKHLAYMIHTSNDSDTMAPRWDRFFKRLDAE